MCFICTQPSGFDTDISTIIGLNKVQGVGFVDKEETKFIQKSKDLNSSTNYFSNDIFKTFIGEFSDYKFYSKGNGVYQIKTDSGYEDITEYSLLKFAGEEKQSEFREIIFENVKETFDQVTGLNTDSGKMFRLYSAAYSRLPDSDGLKYWIEKYTYEDNNDRDIASSFLLSDEFKELMEIIFLMQNMLKLSMSIF